VNIGPGEIDRLLDAMAEQLRELLQAENRNQPAIIGVHSGGVWIAEHLRRRLSAAAPLGELNIAFYRDDFSRIGVHPQVTPSHLPFPVDDRHIVLVDDVLHTGRTVRAAMNEIFDWGRPASICLAVLVERNGRELPVQADVCGRSLRLKPREHVKLSGPEPLALEIRSTG
jgi:pyrimidine operon attenuation protein/uracil phosphoribosyltransferase